tara:strand:+ start:1822 stop:3255 length:1434 start_codon:yes stop_codon:yes gene_type:complete
MSSTTRSLSEHGSFRNAMYQREEEKNNKKIIKKSEEIVSEDTPDSLVKNDKIRMKSAGLNSEICNIEEEISIAQTVERALIHTEDSLIQMQELVDLIGKETEFNSNLRKADQVELAQLINRINKISNETSYGQNILLDGSQGIRGVANGKFLEFVDMKPNPKGIPLTGYEVKVFQIAKRSELKGKIPLTQKIIDNNEVIIFEVDGIYHRFVSKKGETIKNTFRRLSEWISEREIPLEIVNNSSKILHFRHLQYGSTHVFGVSSLTPGLISSKSEIIDYSKPGIDIKGSINGIPCLGHGQFLSAPESAQEISKLTVRYTGDLVPYDKKVGIVSVIQNGFHFVNSKSESFVKKLCLKSIHSSDLGKETENISGFMSLQDIDIKTSQRVKDSLCVIKKSLLEVSEVKNKIKSVCRKTLKSNIQDLQDEHDKLVDSKYYIHNRGNAMAFAELIKNQITENSGRSNMAQAHQNPDSVLTLLK